MPMNRLPRPFTNPLIPRFAAVFLLAGSVSAQSRIIRPAAQDNNNSNKRTHVATLKSSDSTEGSRVAINSDQSLNNYEAYRRGDRFYVKIPAADVPRAEATRGRGFADVKAQRSGDSTVVSFRLQPGATAHVEQRGNKLDVVVSVPGGGTPNVASSRTRDASRPNTSDSLARTETNKRGSAGARTNRDGANSNRNAPETNRNSAKPGNRANASTPLANSNSNRQPDAAKNKPGENKDSLNRSNASSALNSNSTNAQNSSAASSSGQGTPTASPKTSASPSSSPKSSPQAGSTSPLPSPARTASPLTQANDSQGDFWAQMRARAHYWILLAQLNPIPVAVGTFVLLVIIGLLLFQRRRARATRRVKRTESKKESVIDKPSPVAPAAASVVPAPAAAEVAPVAIVAAAAQPPAAPPPEVAATPQPPATVREDVHKQKVNAVAEEARKVFAGDQYDSSIIGSDDPETRRLVGAELASALVGRDAGRRQRGREAFMKYGYFDDATRDLRVAESPNERAAAARRLSFVEDREATPHLIGALSDPEPDVRRAAVEALMDLRDPAAIAPLNSLLQSERDRKVPPKLIQQAIDACATGRPEGSTTSPEFAFQSVSHSAPQQPETEREVIEL